MKEHDLEVHLKIESLGHRKNLIRNIYLLKAIWIKFTGGGHGMNMSENPSILGESWGDDSIIQKSITGINESPAKAGTNRRRHTKNILELSMASGGNLSKFGKIHNNNSVLSNGNQ